MSQIKTAFAPLLKGQRLENLCDTTQLRSEKERPLRRTVMRLPI